jgi:hypothetical protein
LVRQRRNEIQQEVRGLKQQVHIVILVPEYLIDIIGEGFPTDISCLFSAICMKSEQCLCIINFIYEYMLQEVVFLIDAVIPRKLLAQSSLNIFPADLKSHRPMHMQQRLLARSCLPRSHHELIC